MAMTVDVRVRNSTVERTLALPPRRFRLTFANSWKRDQVGNAKQLRSFGTKKQRRLAASCSEN